MADGDIETGDDLYGLDPSEFIGARGALVKELKAAGDKAAAAEVAALRKPSTTAWALNQVARSEPALVEAALAAGAALRAATDAAVAGDPGELRAATAADRKATDALVDAAASRLGPKGTAAKQAMAATVRAAVLDESLADELRRGVLVTEHDAAGFGFGFGDVGGADVIPFRPRAKATPKKAKADGARKAQGGDDDAARRAAEEEEARLAAEAAAAAEAEEREREVRRHRAELEEKVKKLERRAARLAEVADRAEEAAREAREDADDAAAAVEEAKAELADL